MRYWVSKLSVPCMVAIKNTFCLDDKERIDKKEADWPS